MRHPFLFGRRPKDNQKETNLVLQAPSVHVRDCPNWVHESSILIQDMPSNLWFRGLNMPLAHFERPLALSPSLSLSRRRKSGLQKRLGAFSNVSIPAGHLHEAWLGWKGSKYSFLQRSGDFPANHKKQNCKMFPNNNHGGPGSADQLLLHHASDRHPLGLQTFRVVA